MLVVILALRPAAVPAARGLVATSSVSISRPTRRVRAAGFWIVAAARPPVRPACRDPCATRSNWLRTLRLASGQIQSATGPPRRALDRVDRSRSGYACSCVGAAYALWIIVDVHARTAAARRCLSTRVGLGLITLTRVLRADRDRLPDLGADRRMDRPAARAGADRAQPIAQFLAAFPANLCFPSRSSASYVSHSTRRSG